MTTIVVWIIAQFVQNQLNVFSDNFNEYNILLYLVITLIDNSGNKVFVYSLMYGTIYGYIKKKIEWILKY